MKKRMLSRLSTAAVAPCMMTCLLWAGSGVELQDFTVIAGGRRPPHYRLAPMSTYHPKSCTT
jgi:hypothetical protein